jgi:hypothetical protein
MDQLQNRHFLLKYCITNDDQVIQKKIDFYGN